MSAKVPGWGSTGRYTCRLESPKNWKTPEDGEVNVYEDTLSITAFGSFAMVGHDGPHRSRMSPQDLIDFGTELADLGRSMQERLAAEDGAA